MRAVLNFHRGVSVYGSFCCVLLKSAFRGRASFDNLSGSNWISDPALTGYGLYFSTHSVNHTDEASVAEFYFSILSPHF